MEGVFLYPEFNRSSPEAAPGRRARVLVVGVGALGCAAARTLAQDSSVELVLVDDDRVELSNLQRQVLYGDCDIGRLKVEAAAERLRRDHHASVQTQALRFDAVTGAGLLEGIDLVLDATDDPSTKFRIGRLCVGAHVPFIYGGVARTGGQWMLVRPGTSACLECAFPLPTPVGSKSSSTAESTQAAGESAAGCAALGILAPVAGFVGAMQAFHALTFLRHPDRAVSGRLHLYELTGARSRHIDFQPDANCFCSAPRPDLRRQAS